MHLHLLDKERRRRWKTSERGAKRVELKKTTQTNPHCHCLITALSGCRQSSLATGAASVVSSARCVSGIS